MTKSDETKGRRARLKVIQGGSGEAAGSPTRTRIRGPVLAGGLTAKQEAFARKVADGASLSDAYRAAYETSGMTNASVWRKASELMDHVQVSARVNELRVQIEAEEQHSAARIRAFIVERLHHEAIHADQPGARVRALELLGKLDVVRLFDEKPPQQTPDSRTAADLEKELTERLVRLLDERKAGR